MGLNLAEKEQVVAEVRERLGQAQAAVVAEYRGLTVAQMTELRREAHKSGVHLRVVKNTLLRRAIEGTSFSPLDGLLKGPLIFAAGEDPVALAKLVSDFGKRNDRLVVTGGILTGRLIDATGIQQLSKMSSREELLARLMGTMQAPISTFVRTLNEVPGRFVRTLAAVRDQKAA